MPFSRHGQELTTLLNFHLNEENAVLGWALLVSTDADADECALAYFESLIRSLCRVIPANCPEADASQMAKEIHRLVQHMYGLVVVQREYTEELETEISCFSVDCHLALIQEHLSGQNLIDSEDSIIVLSQETVAELDPVQYEVLGAVQEESQLKDALAAANISYSGVGSMRKARKHRHTSADAEEATKELSVFSSPLELLSPPDAASLIEGLCKDYPAAEPPGAAQPPVAQPRAAPPANVDAAAKSTEYSTLLAWLKVLNQPDEVILKKISAFEDYDDRMKKLGAKLKHSMSPEDLIKTLASIQPMPSAADKK